MVVILEDGINIRGCSKVLDGKGAIQTHFAFVTGQKSGILAAELGEELGT